ncbi:MAG: hypothetical protein AAB396_00330 [Patescibacteria group bacterium]
MAMLITYLLNRFIFRIKEFIRHWYIKSFFVYSQFIVSILEKLDRYFALKITWRHIFEPLYQDRTILGYLLGFIFRFWRLAIGGLFYSLIILAAAGLYLVWLLIPFFIIYKIFK